LKNLLGCDQGSFPAILYSVADAIDNFDELGVTIPGRSPHWG
jgi:hypothetical protein